MTNNEICLFTHRKDILELSLDSLDNDKDGVDGINLFNGGFC